MPLPVNDRHVLKPALQSLRENSKLPRFCSARLQAGTLESCRCPPEGGRYTNQNRVLTRTLTGNTKGAENESSICTAIGDYRSAWSWGASRSCATVGQPEAGRAGQPLGRSRCRPQQCRNRAVPARSARRQGLRRGHQSAGREPSIRERSTRRPGNTATDSIRRRMQRSGTR